MAARIGIDTGGTFTDIVRWEPRQLEVHKLPSTPDDPGRAVLAGIAALRRSATEEVDVVHGTTVGLNAVLTGRLARTVLVTNRGCEDLIEIGRQERTELYALAPQRPVPPVPRALRVGVDCRRGPGGAVVTPLRPAEVARVVAAVRRLRPAAIAIGLLHAPADPTDERRLREALARVLPDVPITASAELHAAFGEYERIGAAILNAAIAPIVGGYTQRLAGRIGPGRLRLLRSSLGILPPDEAAAFPARAMFSGPAGGVLASASLARSLRLPRLAAFDMGGTSADLCLVDTATAAHDGGSIAGLPLPLPTVPVHTVGCGGGSIAWVDSGGALRVGPASAGAVPGPACYGRGGDATVTDAHVALGHLGADTLLGGGFPIDVDAAVRAIERLARKLGLATAAAARGILTVANATMARAILVVTAERAIDPATVPLLAYGGAGGLHAAALAAQLGMPSAWLPPLPGAFSALGLALAGDSVEVATAVHDVLQPRSLRQLLAAGRDLASGAAAALGSRGRVRIDALVRYRGQGAALRLPLARNLAAAFTREHQRRYGFTTDAPLEVVRLVARAEQPARAMPSTIRHHGSESDRGVAARPGTRRPPVGGAPLPIHTRLPSGQALQGPAVVEEATATTLVPAGFEARPGKLGLVLRRRSHG
ncbi:MAG: hydantoinase/oxoprolinase family protein [Planctomycetes bacterium]|nr:hydantoinase/oxoprolinase family protein [Planctomycetota bacterium]